MGFMNATRGLRTTHLDSLAKGGVILKNYYVQPICSPTRSALMTGRYTIRLGTQSNVVWWDTPWGVSLKEKFLRECSGLSLSLLGSVCLSRSLSRSLSLFLCLVQKPVFL